jgi:hypothetical protein
VADGVDAGVNRVQAPVGQSMRDRMVPDSQSFDLTARGDAMLLSRQPRHPKIPGRVRRQIPARASTSLL